MIKDWFLNKNFTENEKMLIQTADLTVVKETEKAFQIKAESDYGVKTFWCPKSCTTNGVKPVATAEQMENFKKNGTEIISNNGKKFLFV